MKIWIIKAIVQKSISMVPFKHKINFLFQKYLTKGVALTDDLFEDKLTHCANHIKYYQKYVPNKKRDFVALEIGTGWYPIVPIGLYLSGASQVYTLDISSHLTADRIKATISKYDEWQRAGRLTAYIPDIDMSRFEKLKNLVWTKNNGGG